MAKPNVNTASRDELLGLGLRAPVIDAIIRRRGRKRGINLALLAELPGVGPTTIERLRRVLDFTPPAKVTAATKATSKRRAEPIREPAEPVAEQGADAADTALQAGTEQAAELVAAVTNGDAVAARDAPRIVHEVIEASGLAGTSEPVDAAAAPQARAAEPPPAQVIVLDVGAQSSFGRVLSDLLREQAAANAEAATALARAKSPSDVLRLQGEYLRRTLERMADLNRRWLELAAKTWPEKSAS